jgi:hypothetical protein
MLNIFKKQIHESIELQKKDIEIYTADFAKLILSGDSCDEIPNGYGEFGSITNPIPVNGTLGEIKYLGKLRGETGFPLFFHRYASAESPVYPVSPSWT